MTRGVDAQTVEDFCYMLRYYNASQHGLHSLQCPILDELGQSQIPLQVTTTRVGPVFDLGFGFRATTPQLLVRRSTVYKQLHSSFHPRSFAYLRRPQSLLLG